MSKQTRNQVPEEFDENPEWTEADFARARRGAPWLWREEAIARIREAIAELEPPQRADRSNIERALGKMRNALKELEQLS